MRPALYIALCLIATSCGNDDTFTVTQILDGSSVKLTNGAVVQLEGIANTPDNIPILERYCRGQIQLFDKDTEAITSIQSDRIQAIVYNADGDCVNQLLAAVHQIVPTPPPPSEKTVVKMQLSGGVYFIPAKVNGVDLDFIFDTGASLISLSRKEAIELYRQGKITRDDVVGKGQFGDATGRLSEGLIIKLTSVQIGDRVLQDVLASISEGQEAPLLLGQSALQKFGRISIDYALLEITFE